MTKVSTQPMNGTVQKRHCSGVRATNNVIGKLVSLRAWGRLVPGHRMLLINFELGAGTLILSGNVLLTLIHIRFS